ncbi:MAG: cytochrome c3 family protein [Nitrospinota bacterium]|nr:cytochrome c3 family protein [Nitrospinota bacterium]
MRNQILVFSVFVLAAAGWMYSAVPVQAGDGPGNIVFEDTKSFAPVVFDHAKHTNAGVGCGDCHDALFPKKKGATDAGNALTMKALRQGKYCGSCHNGKQAFSASKNCKQCHRK